MSKPVSTRQRKKMEHADVAAAELDYNARFDGLESKLNKLLQVNMDNNALLNSAVKRIEALEEKFEGALAEVHECGAQVVAQEGRIVSLEKKLQDALDQIEQLENRHRENNLRLLNVPEGHEKDLSMQAFLKLYILKSTRRPLEGYQTEVQEEVV
ncbi:hypothetical protein WMY93_030313 [Mugilogobius chulae]|uniref:Uncharacterized protein n=1 Tax=Mugilogobius chulae TaxID=88201 RepID=A0AAW0MRH1_9GOBI